MIADTIGSSRGQILWLSATSFELMDFSGDRALTLGLPRDITVAHFGSSHVTCGVATERGLSLLREGFHC